MMNGRKLVSDVVGMFDSNDITGNLNDVIEFLLGFKSGEEIYIEESFVDSADGYTLYNVVTYRPETDNEYARRMSAEMDDHERRMEYLKIAADEVGMKLVPKD